MTALSSTGQPDPAEQFIQEYISGRNAVYDIERDWYLRPWRAGKRKPEASGVYARMHPNGWVGFAYFDANRDLWLMAFASRASAQRLADDYLAERAPSGGVYASGYQNAQWSQAPDGLSSFALPLNEEELLTLALLRYAVDPKRRHRGIQ